VLLAMWKMEVLSEGRRSLAYLSSFSISRLPGVLVAMWKIDVYKKGFAQLHICPHFHIANIWRVSRDVENGSL